MDGHTRQERPVIDSAALYRDARHGWRAIVRMPAVAAVVALSLGAGIGVNTLVFSWIQSRVFKPLPGAVPLPAS